MGTGPDPLERDPDDVTELVVQLGAAMLGASSPVTTVKQRIEDLATAFHLDLAFYVLPTGVWAVGYERGPVVALAASEPGTYRFDQTKALYHLFDEALAGHLSPNEGLERLRAIGSMPPRFNRTLGVVGVGLIAVGVASVLEAGWRDLAAAAALGLACGLLRGLAVGRPTLETVLPALAAFVVGVATLAMVNADWIDEPLRVLTPALVTFLPGAMLTIGAMELSAGSLASGSGRMVAGFYALLLLTFGLVVAGSAMGLTTADEITDPVTAGLGPWAPWVGVSVYVIGVGLAFSVPRGNWLSLYLVAYTAWAAQSLTYRLAGGYVSALIGAALGVLMASLAERHLDGPPALLSFTPAFWLLVPGGVSLVGVTRATVGTAGSSQISVALFTIVAIALGVVVGVGVDRWAHAETGGRYDAWTTRR